VSRLEIPAPTSLPAAASSTSCRYVPRIMIGHLWSSRPAVGQRAARLPSWTFESNIHGSDQKVRAPSAVNKRACRAWVGFRIFRYGGVADFQEPTMSLNMLRLAVQVPNLVCQPLSSAPDPSTPPRLSVKFFGCFYAPCIGQLTE